MIFIRALALLVSMLLVGCSSAGFSASDVVEASRTVRPPTYVHPDLVPYSGRFIMAVESAGFIVKETDDPNALQLRLDFDPRSFHFAVTASLIRNGETVVKGEAVNAGWGNLIARGLSIENLVEKAAREFEKQLTSLRGRLKFTESKT